ncbi:MAG: four helix bundle protein [Synechococcaceae cyanobacterium SM1_2_3]|nr:four helix bundle protein [Synechococcaceae cyanobacterium SM1_2_3]
MSSVQSYQDLMVWQRGMILAEQAYDLTRTFPRDELFGMTSQIRRSAASIPANIAEGWARESTAEFIHFIRIAKGSLRELETHLILSQRVKLCPPDATQPMLELAGTLSRQLLALQRSLQQKQK